MYKIQNSKNGYMYNDLAFIVARPHNSHDWEGVVLAESGKDYEIHICNHDQI